MRTPSRWLINSKLFIQVATLFFLGATCTYSQVLEEVVVTAQKREQSVQDVGIAVTTLTGKDIRELGYTSALDVSRQTPGLEVALAYGPGSSAQVVLVKMILARAMNHLSPLYR